MSDLDDEASENFCDSLGESFGVGQNNHATVVGIVHFLLSIRLAAVVNEIGRVVISGKGFGYSFSLPCRFHFICAICANHRNDID